MFSVSSEERPSHWLMSSPSITLPSVSSQNPVPVPAAAAAAAAASSSLSTSSTSTSSSSSSSSSSSYSSISPSSNSSPCSRRTTPAGRRPTFKNARTRFLYYYLFHHFHCVIFLLFSLSVILFQLKKTIIRIYTEILSLCGLCLVAILFVLQYRLYSRYRRWLPVPRLLTIYAYFIGTIEPMMLEYLKQIY